MDLKQDLRCDTIDTREEYEMKVGAGTRLGEMGAGNLQCGCGFRGMFSEILGKNRRDRVTQDRSRRGG